MRAIVAPENLTILSDGGLISALIRTLPHPLNITITEVRVSGPYSTGDFHAIITTRTTSLTPVNTTSH